MLDLGRLRALHAVATYGSVGAAATALGYTPSAVSQQLAKLERETRTTLVEKRGRGIVLTDAAQDLAAAAAEVLGLVEQAELFLEERRGEVAGELTLAAFPTAARGLLPPVLAHLHETHPALTLSLRELDPPETVTGVARGELTVGVVHDWHNTPLATPDELARVRLGTDPADIILPAAHPLADRELLQPADLAGERWICQPEGSICHDWLVRTMRKAGTDPVVAYSVAEYHTQLAMLAHGIGIALIPRLGRGPLPAGVVAVPLRPAPTRRIYAIWRTIAMRRPAVAVTVAALRAGWRDRTTAP
ncbi:MAG TPA: LysR family transcriptional regulator [Kribbellaceae bacterium]|jgi:DNA-binding transcriptional LysR family regulator